MRSLWSTQLLWVLCLVTQLCSALCDPRGCSPPSSSVHGGPPGKKTGVGCHALLQGIFLTQGLDLRLLRLLHCRQTLYLRSHQVATNPTGLGPL